MNKVMKNVYRIVHEVEIISTYKLLVICMQRKYLLHVYANAIIFLSSLHSSILSVGIHTRGVALLSRTHLLASKVSMHCDYA